MSTPTHRPGCSEQRNTKCLCEYLSQWDSKPALPQEIHNTDNPGFESGLTGKGVLRMPNADGSYTEFDLNEPQDWADSPINKLSLPVVIVSGEADPAEVAEKIVRDNPQWFGELPPETYISSKPVAQLQQALSDQELRTKYWHKEYKAARRGFWIAVTFASACAAGLGTVLAWAGVL